MFNFFKRKQDSEDEKWHIFFESLFQYCIDVNDFIYVDCNRYDYKIEYVYSTFPSYYDLNDNEKLLKKMSYKNIYEVLNSLYDKANISTVDSNKSLEDGLQYNIWKITITECKGDKSLHFIVFFVNENSGKKSYRILYYYSEEDTIETASKNSKYLPIYTLNDKREVEAQHFMTTMIALAKYSGIEIPSDLKENYPDLTVEIPVSVKDFERIIELVNLNPFDKDAKNTAQEMYEKFIEEKPSNTGENNLGNFEDNSFSGRFDLINSETNIWESDWKFDSDDVEIELQDILLDFIYFEFEYPEETYSHDLFPYIRENLSKNGFTLMNIQTWADHYIFFVVKSEYVEEIISLSEKLFLEFESI